MSIVTSLYISQHKLNWRDLQLFINSCNEHYKLSMMPLHYFLAKLLERCPKFNEASCGTYILFCIYVLCCYLEMQGLQTKNYKKNGFPDVKNIGVDTKIKSLGQIVSEILAFSYSPNEPGRPFWIWPYFDPQQKADFGRLFFSGILTHFPPQIH